MAQAQVKEKTAEKAKEAPAPKPMKEIVTVKAAALSVDVGPNVLAGLDKSYKDEAKANELLAAVEGKRYDLLSQLTQGILKAATADDSIDLTVAFSGDNKKMNVLNNQLGLALGFREVYTTEAKDGTELKKIDYAKAVSKYFPTAKDDKKAPETKRKETLRGNFLHMVKKCAQAASGIIASDTKVVMDKEAGTLKLSGPAIAKTFGADNVVLNEKQVIGEGEQQVKLTAKPSFTAVAKMGAEAAGKVLTTRKDSRVASNATSPALLVQNIAQSLTEACAKLKGPADADTKRALSIALSAIDKVLAAK